MQKAKALQNKKQEGNNAFGSGQYDKAYDLYTEALEIDPPNKYTNAKLYYNRAVAGSKVQNYLILNSKRCYICMDSYNCVENKSSKSVKIFY